MLAYAFAGNRGLFRVTGTYEGTRFLDRQASDELPAFIDLDALLSFDVTPALGLIVQGQNLLSGNLERWDHYPLSPQIITGGVRVKW
jgi:hypothetical protein